MRSSPPGWRQAFAVAALVPTLALAGCGQKTTTVRVLAASSLAGPFQALAQSFDADHPGVDVQIILGSSATLAQQIQQGAPGDILATADQRTMTEAAGSVGTPQTFAHNQLVLAVPTGNPAGISSIADLEGSSVTYVVCVPEAPCGALARTALTDAGIQHTPASLETDVKAVVTKLESGNADAGLVYSTDVAASNGQLTAIPLPSPISTDYFIATVNDSTQKTLASEFIALVESAAGQKILVDQGFTTGG